MAIFSKGDHSTNHTETTVIASGARIEGQFYFSSMLHVDGEISGVVHSQSSVVVGKNGVVKGQLSADRVVINGLFEGEIDTNHLEILMGGFVNGNVSVRTMAIENGGRLNGSSQIKDENVSLIQSNQD